MEEQGWKGRRLSSKAEGAGTEVPLRRKVDDEGSRPWPRRRRRRRRREVR